MSKSEYTVEDFILDPDFRNWVLLNHPEAKAYWTEFLAQNPNKVAEISQARKILINISREKTEFSDEQADALFTKINQVINLSEEVSKSDKSRQIELDSWSTIQRFNQEQEVKNRKTRRIQWAATLILLLGVGALFFANPRRNESEIDSTEIELVSFEAPSGVKSSIGLEDGSRIHLNSGSKITYPKNFPQGIRSIELTGEAFFEVAKDSSRPFQVKSEFLLTTALGTSFNIKAYPNQPIAISLISGRVQVEDKANSENLVLLNPGEDIQADSSTKNWQKGSFNPDEILAWMNKVLIFKNTPFPDAVRQLENWFGVQVTLAGKIPNELKVSGKFEDETLQNILEGLSYGTEFTYKIEGKKVNIHFKP